MSAQRVNKAARHILILTAILFVLLLSSINIGNYLTPKKVLGAKISAIDNTDFFWQDFLKQNPKYIPGWIEIGRLDKVTEIDPNYLIESGM